MTILLEPECTGDREQKVTLFSLFVLEETEIKEREVIMDGEQK